MSPAETPRIVIVEDDATLRAVMAELFRLQQIEVEDVDSVTGFFSVWDARRFDLVLLDLNLVDEDGLVLLRKVRQRDDVPIFVVSGRDDRDTRIGALEMGADDYICKPFDTQELVLRVKNYLRRLGRRADTEGRRPKIWRFAGWVLDEETRQLTNTEERPVYLTRAEYDLLLALLRARGRPLSKIQLADAVGGGNLDTSPETVAVLIHRLRRKLGDKEIIQTLSGVGYKVQPEA